MKTDGKTLRDAAVASVEVVEYTAHAVLAAQKKAGYAEVNVVLGHSDPGLHQIGTIYVIPSKVARAAFPVLWASEPRKYLYPDLFQALAGPHWVSVLPGLTVEQNGHMSLDAEDILRAQDRTAGLMDAYLKDTLKDKHTVLVYKPMWTTLDRARIWHIDESKDINKQVTAAVKEIYGFFPEPLVTMMGEQLQSEYPTLEGQAEYSLSKLLPSTEVKTAARKEADVENSDALGQCEKILALLQKGRGESGLSSQERSDLNELLDYIGVSYDTKSYRKLFKEVELLQSHLLRDPDLHLSRTK